ncbi:hypothetical protein C1H76_6224 [Elsinoe australis]|uniref:Involucrin repeat protein n=1 Tax=Elsinoe australis TaxID=40998 RepID=A0A4U7ATN2_9PEZI|nr:hypothetical protein C1H76_6224 [Elsinoe australis]
MFGLRRSNSSSSKGNKKPEKSSRTPSLTESAIRAVSNEDEWEDLDGKSEIRSRASTSRSDKKLQKKSRSRSISRDRKSRKESGDKRDSDRRKDKQPELVTGSSRTSRGEKTRGAEDFTTSTRASGFNQFPGQYDQGYGYPQPAPRPLSPHIQSQFPGQFPTDYSHGAFGQTGGVTSEGGYGLAADYYGDQGQSVGTQPGARPPTPELKLHHPPHLQPASATPVPAQDTGNGAAADFYGSSAKPQKPSKYPGASKPPRPDAGTPTQQYGYNQSGPSSNMSDGASFYTATGPAAPWPQQSNSASPNAATGSSEAYYAPPQQPPRPGQSSSSAFQTAAMVGAAGLAAGAYATHHNSLGSHPAAATNRPDDDQFTYRPPSTVGQAAAHQHRHKHRGPLDRLLDLVQNKEDVRRMEEYTEYIGVCKYCFDPKSSARDAPRPHHYHRRRSSDSFKRRRSNESLRQSARRKGKHSGIDKDARYHSSSSSENGGKRNSKAGWLGAGLAGYGIAKVGGALWNQKHDFKDTSTVQSGRSDRPPTYRSKHSDTSRGVVRPDGYNEYVYSQNPDALTVRHPEPRRSSRSRSRDRRPYVAGPAHSPRAHANGVYARRRSRSRSHSPHPHTNGVFIRKKSRSRSRSNSPGLGEIFGFTSPRSKRKSSGGQKKKTKQKGFFNFGNASTSSSDSGLAFGNTIGRRKASPQRRQRRNSREGLDSTLLGIGATAAALAVAQGRRKPEVVAIRDKPSKRRARDRGGVRGKDSSTDEDGWESASDSDAFSASSGLAFGDLQYDKGKQPVRRSSRESLNSESSGTGKWGWRWGNSSKRKERRDPRTVPVSDPMPILPQRAPSYQSPAQPSPIRPADVASVVSSSAMGPMQFVDPMPVQDSPSVASVQPRYEAPPPSAFYGTDQRVPQSSPYDGRRRDIVPEPPSRFVDERVRESDRPRPPAPRRSQSDPSSNHDLRDAAVLGGAAAAAAGIYAATKGRKDDSSVRFEDEQRSRKEQREERRRRDDRPDRDDEHERERARESERTRLRREEAERRAYDRARENEQQAIADRAEHEAQYNMSGALPSPLHDVAPATSEPRPVNLTDRERQLEELIAQKKKELAERQSRETASPPPPYPGHVDQTSYDPTTGIYTQTFVPSRRDTEDEIYSPETPESYHRGREGVEKSETAHTTAARVVADMEEKYTSPQPSQAEYYAKVLEKNPEASDEERRKAYSKVWVPNADAEIHYTMHADEYKRFDPKTRLIKDKDGVPHLGLIVPTPPVSMAGSVKGDKSPVSPQVGSERESPKETADRTREEKAANRVSWGPDDTRFYEIESPAHSPRIPPAGFYPNEPEIEVRTDDKGEHGTTNYKFSDLPAASEPFVADELRQEPEVIEVGRGEPASASGPRGFYQSPFFETVSDLGMTMESPGTEGAPPVQGFIEGEVDEPTPATEKSSYMPGAFDDSDPSPYVPRDTKPTSREASRSRDYRDRSVEEDPMSQSWSALPPRGAPKDDRDFDTRSETWDTGLSKKDRKKKGSKREIVDFASEPAMSERAASISEEPLSKKDLKKREKLLRRYTDELEESKSVEPEEIKSREPEVEDVWEKPMSKKELKKREKLARRNTDDLPSEVSSPQPTVESPAKVEEEPFFEAPLTKKEKKRREKLARQNTDDIESPAETPVAMETPPVETVANDGWEPPLSKKEQKKRDKLAQQNTDDFASPAETPITAVEAEDPWEQPLSKKELKKREKLARQETDDFVTPTETPAGSVKADDAWELPLSKKEQKKREKLARQNTDDIASPAEPIPGAVDAEDPWQQPLSRKEQKKRDKLARQNTDDFEADHSMPLSESPTKIAESEPVWEAPLSKKDRKKLEKECRRSYADEKPSDETYERSGYAASEPGDRHRDERDDRDTRSEAGVRKDDRKSFGDIATALLTGGAAGFAVNEATKHRNTADKYDEREQDERRKDKSRSPPRDSALSGDVYDFMVKDDSTAQQAFNRSPDRNGDVPPRGIPGSFDEPERFETEEERRARKKKARHSGDFDDNMSMVSGYSERSSRSKRDKDESSSKKEKKGGLFEPESRDDKRDKKHHRRKGTGDDDDTRSIASGISRRSTADYGDMPSNTKRERRKDRKLSDESPTEELSRQSTSSKEELRKRDRSATVSDPSQDTQDQSFLAKRAEVEELRSLSAESSSQPARAPESANTSTASESMGDSATLSSQPTSIHPEDKPRDTVMSPESPFMAASQSPSTDTPKRPPILPLRPASATAIPIRFRRPPASPSTSTMSTPSMPRQRAESFSSQVSASPDSPASLTTPRTRASRPRSTEIRREFQPLYLVEHNRKPSELVLEDEPLPPLPISQQTSRASSLRGSDGYESAVEEQVWSEAVETPLPAVAAEDEFKNFDLPSEQYAHWRGEDVLSSNQSTPRASTFPSDVMGGRKKAEPEFYSWEDMLREEKLREEQAAEGDSRDQEVHRQQDFDDVWDDTTPSFGRPIETANPDVPHPEGASTVSNGLDFSTVAGTAALGAGAALAINAMTKPFPSSEQEENPERNVSGDAAPTSTSEIPPTPQTEPSSAFATPLEQPEPEFKVKSSKKTSKKKGKQLKLGTATLTSNEPVRETAEEIRGREERDTQDALEGLLGDSESPGKEWREGKKGKKGKRKSGEVVAPAPRIVEEEESRPGEEGLGVRNGQEGADTTGVPGDSVAAVLKHEADAQDVPIMRDELTIEPTTAITEDELAAEDAPAQRGITEVPVLQTEPEEPIKHETAAPDEWSFTPSKADKKRKGKKGKAVQIDIWNDEPAPVAEAPKQIDDIEPGTAASPKAEEASVPPLDRQVEPAEEPQPEFDARPLSKKELKKLKKGKKVDFWSEEPSPAVEQPEQIGAAVNVMEADIAGPSKADDLPIADLDKAGEPVQEQESYFDAKPLSKIELKKLKRGKKVDLWSEEPSPATEAPEVVERELVGDKVVDNDNVTILDDREAVDEKQVETLSAEKSISEEQPFEAVPLSKKELKKLKKGKKVDLWSEEPSVTVESPDRTEQAPVDEKSFDKDDLATPDVPETLDTDKQVETPSADKSAAEEPPFESAHLSKKELKKLKKGKKVDLWADEPSPAVEAPTDPREDFSASVNDTSNIPQQEIAREIPAEQEEFEAKLSKRELKKLKKGKKVDLWSEEPAEPPAVAEEVPKDLDRDAAVSADTDKNDANTDDISAQQPSESASQQEPEFTTMSKAERKKSKKAKKFQSWNDEPETSAPVEPTIAEEPIAEDTTLTPQQSEAAEPEFRVLSKAERKKQKKAKKSDPWAFEEEESRSVPDTPGVGEREISQNVVEPVETGEEAQPMQPEQTEPQPSHDAKSSESREASKSTDYWGLITGAVAGVGATAAAVVAGDKLMERGNVNDEEDAFAESTPTRDQTETEQIADNAPETASTSKTSRSKSTDRGSEEKRSKSKDEKRKSATSAVLSWVLPGSSKSKSDKDKKSKRKSSSKSRERTEIDDGAHAPDEQTATDEVELVEANDAPDDKDKSASEPLWGTEDVLRDESDRSNNPDTRVERIESVPSAPKNAGDHDAQVLGEISKDDRYTAPSSSLSKPRDYSALWGEEELVRDESARLGGEPTTRDDAFNDRDERAAIFDPVEVETKTVASQPTSSPRDYSNLWGADDIARDESARLRGDEMSTSHNTDDNPLATTDRPRSPTGRDVVTTETSSSLSNEPSKTRDWSQPLWSAEDIARDESGRLKGQEESPTQDVWKDNAPLPADKADERSNIDEHVLATQPQSAAEPAEGDDFGYFVTKKSKKDKKRTKAKAALESQLETERADNVRSSGEPALGDLTTIGDETPNELSTAAQDESPQPKPDTEPEEAGNTLPAEPTVDDTWDVPIKKARKGKKGKRAAIEETEPAPLAATTTSTEPPEVTDTSATIDEPLQVKNEEQDQAESTIKPTSEAAAEDDWGFPVSKKRKGKKGKRAAFEETDPSANTIDAPETTTAAASESIDKAVVESSEPRTDEAPPEPVVPTEANANDLWDEGFTTKKSKKGKKGKRAVFDEPESLPTNLNDEDQLRATNTDERVQDALTGTTETPIVGSSSEPNASETAAADDVWDEGFTMKKSKKGKKAKRVALNEPEETAAQHIFENSQPPESTGVQNPKDAAADNDQVETATLDVEEPAKEPGFRDLSAAVPSEATPEDCWNEGFTTKKNRKGKKSKRVDVVDPETPSAQPVEETSFTATATDNDVVTAPTDAPVREVDPELPTIGAPSQNINITGPTETAADDVWDSSFTTKKARKGKKGKRAMAEEQERMQQQATESRDLDPVGADIVQTTATDNTTEPEVRSPTDVPATENDIPVQHANLEERVDDDKPLSSVKPSEETSGRDLGVREPSEVQPSAIESSSPKQTGSSLSDSEPVLQSAEQPQAESQAQDQATEPAADDEWGYFVPKRQKKGKKGNRLPAVDSTPATPLVVEEAAQADRLEPPGTAATEGPAAEELWELPSSKGNKKSRKAAKAAAALALAGGAALTANDGPGRQGDYSTSAAEDSSRALNVEQEMAEDRKPSVDEGPLERMVMPGDLRDLPPQQRKTEEDATANENAPSPDERPLESMVMPQDLRDLPTIQTDFAERAPVETSAAPTPLGDWSIDPLLDSNSETPDEMWAKMTKRKKGKKSKRSSAIGTPLSKELQMPADEATSSAPQQAAEVLAETVTKSAPQDAFADMPASANPETAHPPPVTPAKQSDVPTMTESPIQESGISRVKESPPRDSDAEAYRQQSSHVSSEEDERQPLLSRRESPERTEVQNATVDDYTTNHMPEQEHSATVQERDQPMQTTEFAEEPQQDEFAGFSLKPSKKDRKKAKQQRKSLGLAEAEEPVASQDTPASPAVTDQPVTVRAEANNDAVILDDTAEPLPKSRSSVPDQFRLSRPLSKFDWADEVESAEQGEDASVPKTDSAGPAVVTPLPGTEADIAADPESEFPITRKVSKKEKRKAKKGKSFALDDEAFAPNTERPEATSRELHASVLPSPAQVSTNVETAEPSCPESPRGTVQSPSRDIDFAATIAAGLAQSGFNSDMVIDDPNFHRRSSPPGTVAEADPEEAFAVVGKKGKKGKKGRKSIPESPWEEQSEQPVFDGPNRKTAEATRREQTDNEDKPASTSPKDDDFAAALTAGLGAAGFSTAMLSRSQEELAKAEAPEDSIFTKSNKKKRKGKKAMHFDDDNTALEDENARKAIALTGEEPLQDAGQAVPVQTLPNDDPLEPADNVGIEAVDTVQETKPEEDEWAFTSKKSRKKGKGKDKNIVTIPVEPEPAAIPDPVVETPFTVPGKKGKKKKRGSAFEWNAEAPAEDYTSAAEPLGSNPNVEKDAQTLAPSTGVGFMHTSEVTQSLPTTIGSATVTDKDQFLKPREQEQPRSSSRVASPASIANSPGWSFDALDKNRDSGIPESPTLPTDDKTRDTIRDSGYDTITDRSNRNSGEKYDPPETIHEIGASDLNASQTSVASWENWELPVNKARSPELEVEPQQEGRVPTPVESTTKNRTSYLFTTPPADSKQFGKSAKRASKDVQERSLSPTSREVMPADYVPRDSSERKRSKASSDVGQPEHSIKSSKKADAPKQSFRERLDSSSRVPSGPGLREDRGSQHSTSQTRLEALRSPGLSNGSVASLQRLRSPDPIRAPSITASIISNESATPSLRRTDRSASGDLRSVARRGEASDLPRSTNNSNPPFRAPPTPPLNDDERHVITPVRGMADNVFEGYGDGEPMPTSPTRPQSVRRKQSMYIADMEARVEALVAENQKLQRSRGDMEVDQEMGDDGSLHRALTDSKMRLQEKDAEINQIKAMLEPLKQELAQLKDLNSNLTEANRNLIADTNDRYGTLQEEHSYANSQWQQSVRELEKLRHEHAQLSNGMESIVRQHIDAALEDKDSEIARLRAELEYATSEIRALQARIQASASDDYLTVRDEDYFDGACQKLCQSIQAWVLRFSKSSDNRACRLSSDIKDDKLETRLDNTMLDGSDVDTLLVDRIRRRDVFMALVMMMVWEYIFTRYLFGMDREQRQKLKTLEKILLETGPPRAVAQWRATTLTLLSRRPGFSTQKNLDHEAVTQEIYSTLAALLPPPKAAESQLMAGLKKVLRMAIDLSIEMRTQRADYFMLPPPTPEYDSNGDLMGKTRFDATTMNERSGEYASNEELQATGSVVKVVLFPLVMKKGDDSGEGGDETVITPAQVLVATSKHSKRVVRRRSGVMDVDEDSRGTGARSRMSLISGGGEGFI